METGHSGTCITLQQLYNMILSIMKYTHIVQQTTTAHLYLCGHSNAWSTRTPIIYDKVDENGMTNVTIQRSSLCSNLADPPQFHSNLADPSQFHSSSNPYQWLCPIPCHPEEVDIWGAHSSMETGVDIQFWNGLSAVFRGVEPTVGGYPSTTIHAC